MNQKAADQQREAAASDSEEEPRTAFSAWIERQPRVFFTVYAMTAAFAAYTSMYAFRKPLAASPYAEQAAVSLFGADFEFKAVALIAQLLGYMCSKFLGIKFASEASLAQRVPIVLGLIAFAELMLVFFALLPRPWNLVALFFNGLPLGMVWSMLFGILEGRRVTEFLGLGLSVSVVFASGWTKGAGLWTIEQWNIPHFWMPAVTGLLFVPLLLLSLGMLYHVPPPDALDRAQRTRRKPMGRAERQEFFRTFFPGVVFLLVGYLTLQSYRALRDDFMDVILLDLGYTVKSSDFAGIESLVGVLVICVLGLLWFFRNNRHAVWANMILVALGSMLTGVSTLLLTGEYIGPRAFFVVNGIGLYIAYVPFQSILVDRLLASLHTVATAAFLLAVADSSGYISVVALYLAKNVYAVVTTQTINWSSLLMFASFVVSIVVPLSMIASAWYFAPRMKE